jgi:hypothetical protein
MSELIPLVSSSTDDFEVALLRSTDHDDLGAEGLLKTAAVLGLGASMMLPTVTTSPLSGAALRLPIWHVVVKWLGLGVLGGIALSGSALLIGSASPQPTAPTSMIRRSSPASKATAARPELPPEAEPAVPVTARSTSPQQRSIAPESAAASEPSLSLAAASSLAAFAPLGEPGAPEQANSIAAQIQTIESARKALEASRPSDALRAISEYHARWPSGTLTPEATMLGVRAKKMLGDASGAERDGRAFIALYPNSRYAAQLRALLGITRIE